MFFQAEGRLTVIHADDGIHRASKLMFTNPVTCGIFCFARSKLSPIKNMSMEIGTFKFQFNIKRPITPLAFSTACGSQDCGLWFSVRMSWPLPCSPSWYPGYSATSEVGGTGAEHRQRAGHISRPRLRPPTPPPPGVNDLTLPQASGRPVHTSGALLCGVSDVRNAHGVFTPFPPAQSSWALSNVPRGRDERSTFYP